MATLERAIELAIKYHSGQKDKAGEPYILHPLRVMQKMETEEEQGGWMKRNKGRPII